MHSAIKTWPKQDQPREKLLVHGEHRLTHTELLAILLRTGVQGTSALDLARRILAQFRSFRNMAHADIRQWRQIKGLGNAKIAQIKAALEMGRRFREEELTGSTCRIHCSRDVAELVGPRMRGLKKEVFKLLVLDSRNRVRELIEVTEGTVNYAYPIVREIFQRALDHHAVSIICVHNHPSGEREPSREDRVFTRRLAAAGEALGIPVLDHVIVAEERYYSFADAGLLEKGQKRY